MTAHYWDTSALGAFLFEEKHSSSVRDYNRAHKALRGATSFLTELEIESVFRRKLNRDDLDIGREDFRGALRGMLSNLVVIQSDPSIVDHARRLINDYSLRSADALQLGTARSLGDRLGQVRFLSLDEKLNRSALAEGLEAPFLEYLA